MTTETEVQQRDTETPKAPAISDPDLSFTDYERLRRGDKLPAKTEAQSAAASDAPKEVAKSDNAKEDGKSKAGDAENDEPELEDEESESEDKSASAKDKTKKQSGGWQRRVDKKTREAADARREADYWKAQALKGAAAEKPQSQETAKTTEASAKDEPQPGNFESHVEYSKALAKWTAKQELDAYKREQADIANKNAKSAVERSFSERVKSFAEKTKDFHDVIADGREQNMFVSEVMHVAIMDSDHGPALFYELAKDPAESIRIGQLPPAKQLMEMGKLESRISSAAAPVVPPKTETKKTTDAPRPLDPVGGGKVTAARSLDDPDLPFAEFVRMRREQQKRRRA